MNNQPSRKVSPHFGLESRAFSAFAVVSASAAPESAGSSSAGATTVTDTMMMLSGVCWVKNMKGWLLLYMRLLLLKTIIDLNSREPLLNLNAYWDNESQTSENEG